MWYSFTTPMISFKSKTIRKILQYFFVNKGVEPHVRDLGRILDEDASNLSKKLKELEKEKILISEENGTKKYSLNEDYALLPEIKKLFLGSFGLPIVLNEALKKIPGLLQAFIFGSYAKGGFSEKSDVDFLLIGSHSSLAAKRAIIPLQKALGREFNIIDMTKEEFDKKISKKDPFLTSVMKGKLIRLI